MLHFQQIFCVAGSQRVSFSGVSAVQDARHKLQHVQGAQTVLVKIQVMVTMPRIQDYGVGQTAAEYINGAFNGQKGFKASQKQLIIQTAFV